MNKVLQSIRLLVFLIFASFASSAMSITIGSVLGGASLDGTWAFPECMTDCQNRGDLLDSALDFALVESDVYTQGVEAVVDTGLDGPMLAQESLTGMESVRAVPLPASLWLFGVAIVALIGNRLRTTIDWK